MDNRPRGREKNITGHSGGVNRRGSGLGTGPVGGGTGGFNNRGNQGGRGPKRGGGSSLLILLLALLFGGGGAMSFMGGDSSEPQTSYSQPSYSQSAPVQQSSTNDPFGFFSSPIQSSGSGWQGGNNTGRLNTQVDPSARAKRTQILGNGQDQVTVMVYMCGTDLESRSGMGTKDLQEMINATLSDSVNLIVYTGGCNQWKNNVVSSSVNQIYQIQGGGMRCLVKNAGTSSMTDPNTLDSFIQFCGEHFPANRNMLILWDHGGGSISGYGYDEKDRRAGSMTLNGLDQALKSSRTSFDFIGFDACLMGTLENALTMAPYADYLIASEETEPGLGWYYTNWLTQLSRNPGISTLELGKMIADDFVSACAQSCPGQKTTLSVVDLAELEATIPQPFKDFSASTLFLLKNDGYKTVANARSSVREFAVSSKCDQIDLVHLAQKLDTAESRKLAQAVLNAVKYNKTSSNMTNANGLSLYFPYQKAGNVNNAIIAYNAIGLEDSYTDCIRVFANMELSGQAAAGGSTSPMTTLNGGSYGSNMVGGDLLTQLLSQMLSGGGSFDRSFDPEATADYLTANRFDPDALVWTANGSSHSLHLSENQWSLVDDLNLNVFVDDGEGYIDLGLDNTFDFTENGDLVGEYDGTWLAIDGQNIAYYHTDTTEDGDHYTITGYVPVLLNGERAQLILVFTDQQPYGVIAGARTDYRDGETDTVAKGITELEVGDIIDFLCDYYRYDGTYQDSYFLGEQHIYNGHEQISNVYIDSQAVAAYRFTDIYNNSFWTPVIP